jgi:hypothetical protein
LFLLLLLFLDKRKDTRFEKIQSQFLCLKSCV